MGVLSFNPYEVLGLDPARAAQIEYVEIRAAWLELVQQWHPDKHGQSREATERAAQINAAHDALKPDARDATDRHLADVAAEVAREAAEAEAARKAADAAAAGRAAAAQWRDLTARPVSTIFGPLIEQAPATDRPFWRFLATAADVGIAIAQAQERTKAQVAARRRVEAARVSSTVDGPRRAARRPKRKRR